MLSIRLDRLNMSPDGMQLTNCPLHMPIDAHGYGEAQILSLAALVHLSHHQNRSHYQVFMWPAHFSYASAAYETPFLLT